MLLESGTSGSDGSTWALLTRLIASSTVLEDDETIHANYTLDGMFCSDPAFGLCPALVGCIKAVEFPFTDQFQYCRMELV